MWFDTILWLVAIVAFIAVEAATTALVSVWFAVGAAAAMAASFFNIGFGWQALVFIGHYAGADDSHPCQPPR